MQAVTGRAITGRDRHPGRFVNDIAVSAVSILATRRVKDAAGRIAVERACVIIDRRRHARRSMRLTPPGPWRNRLWIRPEAALRTSCLQFGRRQNGVMREL